VKSEKDIRYCGYTMYATRNFKTFSAPCGSGLVFQPWFWNVSQAIFKKKNNWVEELKLIYMQNIILVYIDIYQQSISSSDRVVTQSSPTGSAPGSAPGGSLPRHSRAWRRLGSVKCKATSKQWVTAGKNCGCKCSRYGSALEGINVWVAGNSQGNSAGNS